LASAELAFHARIDGAQTVLDEKPNNIIAHNQDNGAQNKRNELFFCEAENSRLL